MALDDGFSPTVDVLIYIGGAVASGLMWIIGRGRGKQPEADKREEDRLTALERALAAAHERDQTDRDMAALRREIEGNLQQVIKASTDSLVAQLAELSRQVLALKKQVAQMRQRLARLAQRAPK